jgi:hypothetical protein
MTHMALMCVISPAGRSSRARPLQAQIVGDHRGGSGDKGCIITEVREEEVREKERASWRLVKWKD